MNAKMKIRIWMALLNLLFGVTVGSAQPVCQYLHEGWSFRQARGTNWYEATVPGTVHTDLLDNKLIDDPFFRLNERGVQWVDKEDWIYRTTFNVSPELLAKKNIMLHFEGLDTYADVTLNGKKVLSADNMFREWQADVRSLLKEQGNELQVYLHSPIKIAMPKWEAVPFEYRSSNDQSENGGLLNRKVGVFVRKAGYHFGWDWGPRLVTSGIWRTVSLEAWDEARINDVFYNQKSVTARQAVIDVTVEVLADKETEAKVSVINRTDNRTECWKSVRLNKGLNKIPVSFTMKNPRLWWTNGLGEPFLYDFATTLELSGEPIDAQEEKLGIRSLKVVTAPDEYGESFYFELNGKPLFAKGANYIPCDNFLTRVTDSIYEKTIQDAVSANMNMLRVWGGGVYEKDIFYDLCDKYGILIWQDFMFACSVFPAEGELLENIRKEAIDNVRRLRNHSCIALWCGNNECLDAWFNWNWKKNYDKQNPAYSETIWEQFKNQYFVTLPAVVEEHHPGACYRKSSPYSDDMGTRNHTVGDMHYWEVWQGLKPLSQFNHEKSRFFSEYGFQSFPEFESIKRYAPLPEDWNLTSEVMMFHQRGGAAANKRINDFLLSEYRQPKDFRSFTYMSQLLQADAMKMAMEAHRRDMPYCMGSLVWQHNDCWPVASWSSRDFYGRWKAQHYFTVKSFADLLISPMEEEDLLKIYLVSDRLKNTSGELVIRAVRLNGKGTVKELTKKISVPANTSTVVWTEDIRNLLNGLEREEVVIHVLYKDRAGQEYTNNFFPAKQKDMRYVEAKIAKELVPVEGGYEVTLSSDAFARGVFLSLEGDIDNFISDNYMDILPEEAVKVKVTTNMPPSQFAEKLRVTSFMDHVVNTGKLDFCADWKFKNEILTNQPAASEYDDSAWQTVDLPHTWNATDAQDGGGDYLRTVGWYRKELVWDNQFSGKKAFLEFLGANMQAECFVNGHSVGQHKGGYTAFRFDITEFLQEGRNIIAMKVDNRYSESIAPLTADFSFFGGIYRKAFLVITDNVHIDRMDNGSSGLYLTPRKVSDKSATLEVRALVKNESTREQRVTICAELAYPDSFKDIKGVPAPLCDIKELAPGGKPLKEVSRMIIVPAGGEYEFKEEWLVENPRLWNGRTSPFRYSVNMKIISESGKVFDFCTDYVGFRYFTVNEKGFFLNGKPYPLRGVNRHQDRKDMGNAITEREHEEDFGMIYEIGANAIRLAHYPQDPYFYDLCDRYGIVVWAEIPFVDRCGTNSDFGEVTKQQLRELIRQQYNRPSICFWGLQNEVKEQYNEQMTGLMKELNELAHREDSTGRLTTLATNHEVGSHWDSDVVAWNIYPGWYVPGRLGERMDTYRKGAKYAAISEYGAGGSIHQHEMEPKAEIRGTWHPEEYQSLIHQNAIIDISTRDYVWGTFVWNMFDFASDNRKEGDHFGINDKGLVTYDRKVRKDSFYAYKVNWSKVPTVHITGSRFKERSEPSVPVMVYSNCDAVELFVNGKSYGVQKKEEVQCGFFLWENVNLLPTEGSVNEVVAKGHYGQKEYTDSLHWKTVAPAGIVK